MKRKKTKKSKASEAPHGRRAHIKQPFRQHLQELRRRFFYIAISIVLWCVAAYAVEHHIIEVLLKPAHDQQFIYTSPIGGIDFLFRVTLYTAFIMSVPVVVYNVLSYMEPLISRSSKRFIIVGSIAAAVLAACGIAFGYYVGLPGAMHFLMNQFITPQIKPLLTVQSYLEFVMAYLLGCALMLQIPLILIFINRIKPLKPRQLFRYERWVILGAFVLAALINPTPSVIDQLLIAGPLIIMYQVGILIIAITNRRHQRHTAKETERLPAAKESVRLEPSILPAAPMAAPRTVVLSGASVQAKALDVVGPKPRAAAHRIAPAGVHHPRQSRQPRHHAVRPRQYVDGFIVTRQRQLNPAPDSPYSI